VKTVGPVIRLTDLPSELFVDASDAAAPHIEAGRQASIETLRRTGGTRTVTARLLGLSRATLYRRLAAVEEAAASQSVSRQRRPATAADTADVSLTEPLACLVRVARETPLANPMSFNT
jgi:hypothetical protein